MDESTDEIDHIEGTGSINFFSLDDLKATQEGEEIKPESIIILKTHHWKINFPAYDLKSYDVFIRPINKSGKKWVIFTYEKNEPRLVFDSDGFLRSELFCHAPLVIGEENTNLAYII